MDFGNGEPLDNILIFFQGSGYYLNMFNVTSENGLLLTNVFSINEWSHLAFTYYEGNVSLYTNGNQSGTTAGFALGNVVRNNNYFGKSNWPLDPPVNLTLDEIKIYNRPLSWTEIKMEMNKTQPIAITID